MQEHTAYCMRGDAFEKLRWAGFLLPYRVMNMQMPPVCYKPLKRARDSNNVVLEIATL